MELEIGVEKFNQKWQGVEDALDTIELDNDINCDMMNLIADQGVDQWAQEIELDDMFSVTEI